MCQKRTLVIRSECKILTGVPLRKKILKIILKSKTLYQVKTSIQVITVSEFSSSFYALAAFNLRSPSYEKMQQALQLGEEQERNDRCVRNPHSCLKHSFLYQSLTRTSLCFRQAHQPDSVCDIEMGMNHLCDYFRFSKLANRNRP